MARAAHVALGGVAVVLAGAATAIGPAFAAANPPGWGRPFQLVAPSALDVTPAQAAFSQTGAIALGYGVQDIDNPASSVAFASAATAPKRLGRARVLAGGQRTLALGYDGTQLTVLVGSSRHGLACCGFVDVVTTSPAGAFGRPRKLVKGLAGATAARLVGLPGRLLGAIATERGVWLSQSGADGRFARARRLTGAKVLPEALDATSTGGDQSIVAWAATIANPVQPGTTTAPGARSIFIAQGSVRQPPRRARAAITVSSGHSIDELGLAGGPRRATVAWIESWYDASGVYHANAMVADLGRSIRALDLSPPGELASGIAFAADANGDQVLSWKGCAASDACVTRATVRPARGRFTAPAELGGADPSQAPAAAVGPTGDALVAWIDQGHVLASSALGPAGRFGTPTVVSRTDFAADIALAFSPLGQALATWTQGTLTESVVGAVFGPR